MGEIILIIITALVSGLLGAILSQFLAHWLAIKRIKEEILLREKLEYFKSVTNSISKRIEYYRLIISAINHPDKKINTEAISSLLLTIEKQEINFTRYLLFSDKISFLDNFSNFIEYEADIHKSLNKQIKNEIIKESIKQAIKEQIKIIIDRLHIIITKMRKELES